MLPVYSAGNCFYRSFIYSYIERLIRLAEAGSLHEAVAFAEKVRGCKQVLLDAGFQDLVFEDSLDMLVDLISSIGNTQNPITQVNSRPDSTINVKEVAAAAVAAAAAEGKFGKDGGITLLSRLL